MTVSLLFVARSWSGWAIRIVLGLAAVEWLRALVVHARRRAEAGEPWTRLAIILGAVAALSALAAWLHRPRPAAPESD